uniref:Uncharacterized protein n=1 Tax=Panagrolaimus sp. JU765 TaxID=591449 RepID=A0AC34QEI4_9BILA
MIVMDGRLILFWAILPVFIPAKLPVDFRAVKYAERNGDCFVDVYQPSATDGSSEPLANRFIRQTFKSECYPGHVVHGFNLVPNGKDGYRLTGCFYFKEKQTLKCEQFEGDKFVQTLDVSCNNASIFKNDKVYVYISPDKYEVYDKKDVCAFESDKNYVSRFYQRSDGSKQYNAITNESLPPNYNYNEVYCSNTYEVYDKKDVCAFESDKNYVPRFDQRSDGFHQYDAISDIYRVTSNYNEFYWFGDLFFYKGDVHLIKVASMVRNWSMDYDYVFDNKQAPGKVELPFSTTFYGIKYVVDGPNKCAVVISDVISTENLKN